jgi:integrase
VIGAFNDPRIKRVAEARRRGLAPREADKAKFTLSRLVRFCIEDENFGLDYNHIRSLKTRYKCDRSAIVWRPEEIAAFEKVAAEPLRRFFVMSVETGLRPGDLRRLTRNHIEDTAKGRRIFLRTNKRKRDVSIPVTARAAEIIDETPARQLLVCASPPGLLWDAGNFGTDFRAARKAAKVRAELRLYDTRGTAATLLLHAGLGLDEIAVWMGWSLQYAGQMIATYARVDPDKTDATLVKLEPWLAQRAARMAAAK